MARLLTAMLLLALSFAALSANAKELEIGRIGSDQILTVIADDWVVRAEPDLLPSARSVRLSRGEPAEILIFMTVLKPEPGSPLSNARPDTIARLVGISAAQASAQSVEGDLTTKAFDAGRVMGSYFSATDKAPPPGEFKYMTQGIASFGDFAVTFTALSHEDPAAARSVLLDMVSSLQARQLP